MVQDVEVGRAADAEAALSASPTAPVVAALPGNDQPRDYVNEMFAALIKRNADGMRERETHVLPRVSCKSGLNFSVQASSSHYCSPRDDRGPWHMVEIGYPTRKIPAWLEYAEEVGAPLQTVYGYVPVAVVNATIAANGGWSKATEKRLAEQASA